MIRKAAQFLLNSVRGGWHLLVWEDVRAGTIKLTGTPRSFRVLIRLGFWLTIFLLITLVFNDVWRGFSQLQPLTFYNDELAGLYVPDLFVPVMFGLLAIAWAFLLTGALHTPWPVKLLILILFGMFNYGLMITPISLMTGEIDLLLNGFSIQQTGVWSSAAVLVQGVGWMFLLVFFVVRWRRPVRPGLEFPLVLSTTTGLLFAAYFAVQLSGSTTGASLSASGLQLTFALGQMNTVLVPFLVLAGVEVVQLGMSLTGMVASRIGETFEKPVLGPLFWTIGVGALLFFRLGQQWVWPLLTGAEIPFSWGAVIILGVFLLIFAVIRPHRLEKSLPGWVIPAVALLMYAVLFVLEIGSLLSVTVGVVLILAGAVALGNVVVNFMADFFDLFARWNEILVSAVAGMIGAGLWGRAWVNRKPFPPAAFYLFLFALWVLWWIITRPGRWLSLLTFRYEHFDAVATLFLFVLFAGALVLRRLTPRTLLFFTASLFLFWVLEARDLLDDPLSPMFVWLGAQAAFLSVSVLLNVMSAGNRFALNTGSPRWPRPTRGLLYLGYALLTVISMNWLVAGHQADALAIKDQIAQNGFLAVGLPLAAWALMTGNEMVMGKKTLPTRSPIDPSPLKR